MELETEYCIKAIETQSGHKRDHSSIDKRRQGCHGDLRTSGYETVDALAPTSVFHFLL